MSTRPTIYVSNWASGRSPGRWGPGRKLTIMARTPEWAVPSADGRVDILAPSTRQELADLDELLRRRRTELPSPEFRAVLARYRESLAARWMAALQRLELSPGKLSASLRLAPGETVTVAEGDTLNCVCSAVDAGNRLCHRAWACEILEFAGWDPVLDGIPFAEVRRGWRQQTGTAVRAARR